MSRYSFLDRSAVDARRQKGFATFAGCTTTLDLDSGLTKKPQTAPQTAKMPKVRLLWCNGLMVLALGPRSEVTLRCYYYYYYWVTIVDYHYCNYYYYYYYCS